MLPDERFTTLEQRRRTVGLVFLTESRTFGTLRDLENVASLAGASL